MRAAGRPIAEKYGARFIAGREGAHETREGEEFARVLLVEFPSYEQARAAYDDPDYQAALPYARDAYARRESDHRRIGLNRTMGSERRRPGRRRPPRAAVAALRGAQASRPMREGRRGRRFALC